MKIVATTTHTRSRSAASPSAWSALLSSVWSSRDALLSSRLGLALILLLTLHMGAG